MDSVTQKSGILQHRPASAASSQLSTMSDRMDLSGVEGDEDSNQLYPRAGSSCSSLTTNRPLTGTSSSLGPASARTTTISVIAMESNPVGNNTCPPTRLVIALLQVNHKNIILSELDGL